MSVQQCWSCGEHRYFDSIDNATKLCGDCYELNKHGMRHQRAYSYCSIDEAKLEAKAKSRPVVRMKLENGNTIEFNGYENFGTFTCGPEPEPFYVCPVTQKVADRLQDEGHKVNICCRSTDGKALWEVVIPPDFAQSLTPDQAPELERRIRAALRILKEGK